MINDKSIMWACSPFLSPTQQLLSSWQGLPWTVGGYITAPFFSSFLLFPLCLHPSSCCSTLTSLSSQLLLLFLFVISAVQLALSVTPDNSGSIAVSPPNTPAFTFCVSSDIPPGPTPPERQIRGEFDVLYRWTLTPTTFRFKSVRSS